MFTRRRGCQALGWSVLGCILWVFARGRHYDAERAIRWALPHSLLWDVLLCVYNLSRKSICTSVCMVLAWWHLGSSKYSRCIALVPGAGAGAAAAEIQVIYRCIAAMKMSRPSSCIICTAVMSSLAIAMLSRRHAEIDTKSLPAISLQVQVRECNLN